MRISSWQKLGFVTAVVVAVAVSCAVAYRQAGGRTGTGSNASATGNTNSSSNALAVPLGSSSHTIESGGRQRGYRLYRPADLVDPAPLVVMLHGGFGSAARAENNNGWDAEADSGHFLVLYPDGVDRAWNAGGGCWRATDGCAPPTSSADGVVTTSVAAHPTPAV